MTTVTMATITKITEPERLFSAPENVEKEYHAFAKLFHPDLNKDKIAEANNALATLNILRAAAKQKIKNGEWQTPGLFEFSDIHGKKYRIRFIKEFTSGIFKAYVGEEYVSYVFSKDLKDLVENAQKVISGFRFPKENPAIEKSISPALPKLKTVIETSSHMVMVFEKPKTFIRLKDVFEHYNHKMDPKHIAWVLSRCYNIVTYLEWLGYGHHDLSMENIFIEPESHLVCVIGGWWFASPVGARMTRLQASRTIKYAPRQVLNTKLTSISTDLELIRLLGRELLNDETGVHLSKNPNNPPYMVNWLRMITSGKAKKDYKDWDENLKKMFGVKKFTVMDLTAKQVYKE